MSNKVAPAENDPLINAPAQATPGAGVAPSPPPRVSALFQGSSAGGSSGGAVSQEVMAPIHTVRPSNSKSRPSSGEERGTLRKKSSIDIAWGSIAHLTTEDHPEDSLMDLMTGKNVKDPIAKSGSESSMETRNEKSATLKSQAAIQTSAFRRFGPELLKLVSPLTEVHEDDAHHETEHMNGLVIKALRHRREQNFANEIKGSVMDGKISNWLRHSYAAPSMSTVPLIALITVYVVPFYESLGADLAMLAFFQAMARGFDVITDPAMSYFTDSLRSSWGRRRPFMFIGCVPYGLALIFLCSPFPGLTSAGLAAWFGAFYILFFLCNTFTNIPYDALCPELTDNQADRQKLYFLCSLYDGVGMVLAIVLPVLLSLMIYPQVEWNGSVGMDSSSCEIPVDGMISLRSCQMFGGSGRPLDSTFGNSLTKDQSCRAWELSDTAANLGFNQTRCDICSEGIVSTYSDAERMEYNFCTCLSDCDNVFKLDNERRSFFAVGMFFGLWYMFTMFNAAWQVKERAQSDGGSTLPAPAPMMASMLNTFKNKAFTTLLPAWVCDSLYAQIFLAMLPYYIKYVIEPEFSNEGCSCDGELVANPKWYCDSKTILFISVLALIICALLALPMWLWLAAKFGKRNAWLLWSFSTAITNTLFAFCGKGDYVSCIVFCGINGIPLGAKFLAEAILADVIDYDEFLTGARSEATYTMFKQFLPKIAAIPASAIPLSLLGYYGHISPIDGVVQKQTSAALVPYLNVVFVAIPSLMAVAAFLLKLRFPIKANEKNDKIVEGVAKHLLGLPADCPLSGTPYRLYHMDAKTKTESYKIDNFMGLGIAKGLLAKPVEYVKKLKDGMGLQLGFGLLLLGLSSMMLGLTYRHFKGDAVDVVYNDTTSCPVGERSAWMNDDFVAEAAEAASVVGSVDNGTANVTAELAADSESNLSFLPVIAMVLIGISITVIQWASLRLAAAVDLEKNPVSAKTLQKVIKQRRLKNKCADIQVKFCGGFTKESQKHMMPQQRRLSAGYDDEDDAPVADADNSNTAPDSQAGVSVM